jgi:hypothetical protein
MSVSVQVFGGRDYGLSTDCGGRRPKSAKARSRGKLGHRWCNGRYGDLMLAPNSGMDLMPAECGWRICILRPEAGDGRLGERWELVSELRERRAR